MPSNCPTRCCSCATSSGLADAVAAFAAAQGSRQQQQYHLADLAAELLAPRNPAAAPPAGQRQLLVALPDALLGDVCRHVYAGADCNDEHAALLRELLLAVRQLPEGQSDANPVLQQAARHALTEQLLPALPPPASYPMSLAALTGEEANEQLLSPQTQCWAAALRCPTVLRQLWRRAGAGCQHRDVLRGRSRCCLAARRQQGAGSRR